MSEAQQFHSPSAETVADPLGAMISAAIVDVNGCRLPLPHEQPFEMWFDLPPDAAASQLVNVLHDVPVHPTPWLDAGIEVPEDVQPFDTTLRHAMQFALDDELTADYFFADLKLA